MKKNIYSQKKTEKEGQRSKEQREVIGKNSKMVDSTYEQL